MKLLQLVRWKLATNAVQLAMELTNSVIKGYCPEDFAVLGQFRAKIISLRL